VKLSPLHDWFGIYGIMSILDYQASDGKENWDKAQAFLKTSNYDDAIKLLTEIADNPLKLKTGFDIGEATDRSTLNRKKKRDDEQ
jgi:hypothetical protein